MNCPYCGSRLSIRDRCDRCGEDMTIFKKVYRIANQYYNIGVRKAQVRDLSGAVMALHNCLRLNKKHTDARNLLGLIYQEMGENVSALSQWVLSKHFQSEDNEADYYLNLVQRNPSRLDSVNQVIKKYNSALTSARQGSDDLAIIQLKKVVSMNPHYVQALQLLALLYIHNKEYERAKKYLKRAAKVDVTNTTTLTYLEELRELGVLDDGEPAEETRSRDSITERDVIVPAHTYAEEKPNIMAWVNLVLGVIIGAAFIMIAIVPGIRKQEVRGESTEIVELNEQLVKLQADLEAAEGEKSALSDQITDLNKQVKKLKQEQDGKEEDTPKQEDLSVYETLMQAAVHFLAEQEIEAADLLVQVDRKKLKLKQATELYGKLSGQLFEEQSQETYQNGHALYTAGKYEDALKEFEKAIQMNPDNVDAMYFTGRAYHRLEQYEEARTWYNRLVEDYPDTGRAGEAKGRLRELPAEPETND